MENISLSDFIETKEKCNSNSKRLDCLERIADAIHQQSTCLAELVIELKYTNDHLKRQDDHLKAHDCKFDEIEKVPRTRWNQVILTAITAIVGGLIGAVIAKLIK